MEKDGLVHHIRRHSSQGCLGNQRIQCSLRGTLLGRTHVHHPGGVNQLNKCAMYQRHRQYGFASHPWRTDWWIDVDKVLKNIISFCVLHPFLPIFSIASTETSWLKASYGSYNGCLSITIRSLYLWACFYSCFSSLPRLRTSGSRTEWPV